MAPTGPTQLRSETDRPGEPAGARPTGVDPVRIEANRIDPPHLESTGAETVSVQATHVDAPSPANARPHHAAQTLSVHVQVELPLDESAAQSADRRDGRRIDGFDLVRVLSAINVIAFHCVAETDVLIGRGGLPAFLMMASALPAIRGTKASFGSYAGRRARRVLIPWVFWSFFYAIVAAVRYIHHGIVPSHWTIHWIFVGTAIHLWFFPAVFVGGLGVWWLLSAVRGRSARRTGIAVTAAGLLLLALHPLVALWALPTPYGQWLFAIPALVLGVGLGLCFKSTEGRPAASTLAVFVVAVLLASGMNLAAGSASTAVSYSVAGVLLPAALIAPARGARWIRPLAAVCTGIYAIHPFVLLMLTRAAGDGRLSSWMLVPVVFVIAATASALLRLHPWGTLVA